MSYSARSDSDSSPPFSFQFAGESGGPTAVQRNATLSRQTLSDVVDAYDGSSALVGGKLGAYSTAVRKYYQANPEVALGQAKLPSNFYPQGHGASLNPLYIKSLGIAWQYVTESLQQAEAVEGGLRQSAMRFARQDVDLSAQLSEAADVSAQLRGVASQQAAQTELADVRIHELENTIEGLRSNNDLLQRRADRELDECRRQYEERLAELKESNQEQIASLKEMLAMYKQLAQRS